MSFHDEGEEKESELGAIRITVPYFSWRAVRAWGYFPLTQCLECHSCSWGILLVTFIGYGRGREMCFEALWL